MEFFTQAVNVLKILVMEGYGNDNPCAKSQGIKQLIPN